MVKKSTLESILQQEMSDFWALLENEEKRIIAENSPNNLVLYVLLLLRLL